MAASANASGSTGARPQSGARESFDRLPGFIGRQVDDEIDVGGETCMAVEHSRDASDHHVSNSRGVQGFEEWLEERHLLELYR
jgi:hypothetical protein